MILDFLADYAWVIWVGLILLFAIVELTTLQFTFMMLALGSLGGLISALAGLPWWAQVVIAGVLSMLLIFAVRPPLLRALGRGSDPAKSNIDALLGTTGVITNDFSGNANHVKLANGETWTARPDGDGRPLVAGQTVVVLAIDGATAVVALTERITP